MESVVYLDTHLVIWLYSGQLELIPEESKALLKKGNLLISPIVELEIQYLFEIKKIKKTAQVVIRALQNEINLQYCKRDFISIIQSAKKMKWTRDPFDRIITAQASIGNNILITKDSTIAKYYKMAFWK